MATPEMSYGPSVADDPVCGMEVETRHPPGGTAEHQGKTYYFCSASCREKFEADPSAYV
ncbi:MAG: YHS domain-containing protein [Dehalococcoidia bacterium]